jgi:uncharacterized protein (DUF433 family)
LWESSESPHPSVLETHPVVNYHQHMSYQSIITIEPGKRGGRPCIRRMRIAVADVLGWLAAGMTHQAIIADYPELTEEDILACLAYAADRERRLQTAA